MTATIIPFPVRRPPPGAVFRITLDDTETWEGSTDEIEAVNPGVTERHLQHMRVGDMALIDARTAGALVVISIVRIA